MEVGALSGGVRLPDRVRVHVDQREPAERRLRDDPIPPDRAGVPLGTIVLFRNIESPPFTPGVAEFMASIRPFLALLFAEFATRLLASRPPADLFREALRRVSAKIGLSDREREVLRLLLLGNTGEEIAGRLGISPATVRKHANAIYRKTGVRRLSEFFTRYLSAEESEAGRE